MNNFQVPGYEALELSTQIIIEEALKRGVEVEILDPQDDFIRLKKLDKVEYLKQATKTSADTYITALLMENKVVTKQILSENGFSVPIGDSYTSIDLAMEDRSRYEGRGIVIKPKSTNFGIGINILSSDWGMEAYEKALKDAFLHDVTVLVEAFIPGNEYRFLVIGDRVMAVLHRVPANVEGDGVKTIESLINEKNKHPFRGKGYKTPLEKIEMGEIESSFLSDQGIGFDSVPKKGEIVFLRSNSNISTGGDSIDFTDDVHESYKEIALNASKSVGAAICGVDIIIADPQAIPNDKNHGIIELNFNPVLYFHDYPYVGKNRAVGGAVLDLLGF